MILLMEKYWNICWNMLLEHLQDAAPHALLKIDPICLRELAGVEGNIQNATAQQHACFGEVPGMVWKRRVATIYIFELARSTIFEIAHFWVCQPTPHETIAISIEIDNLFSMRTSIVHRKGLPVPNETSNLFIQIAKPMEWNGQDFRWIRDPRSRFSWKLL